MGEGVRFFVAFLGVCVGGGGREGGGGGSTKILVRLEGL